MDPLKKLNELENRIHALTNEAREAANERERLTKMVECQTENQHLWDFVIDANYNLLGIERFVCKRCGTIVNINQYFKIYTEEEE